MTRHVHRSGMISGHLNRSLDMEKRKIAVVGLGYVGLPVALHFARRHSGVVGFDIDPAKVERLCAGNDATREISAEELHATSLHMTSDMKALSDADFYIVAVPTPVDENHSPDLGALRAASRTVGAVLKKGDIVVFESTVYPGVTEDVCGPILARESGLICGQDFHLGYSPERINPGDQEHTFEKIVKVVAGQDADSLDVIDRCYSSVVHAGVHRAPSIKVAEAAKVIENTQRDLNIALMNELALIFDRLGIRTRDVLDAAMTKWNFLPFVPGLVGGHCIGVDPYYLTTLAEQMGVHPQVILAGRRINDGMGSFVAQKAVKMMIESGLSPKGARAVVLGFTFKEDVPDIRNSRVPDIVKELRAFGVETEVYDPVADAAEALQEYGETLAEEGRFDGAAAVIYAVNHDEFRGLPERLFAAAAPPAVFIDVKSCVDPATVPDSVRYWSL